LTTAEDGELLVAISAGAWNNTVNAFQPATDPVTPSSGTLPFTAA
jgi:hypothetical protein